MGVLLLQVWRSTAYYQCQNCCKKKQPNVRSEGCSGSSDARKVSLTTLLCVVLAASSLKQQIAVVLQGEQQRWKRQRGGFCLCIETQIASDQRPVNIERK